jgi:hypothetical protein
VYNSPLLNPSAPTQLNPPDLILVVNQCPIIVGIPSISSAWRVHRENYLRAWCYFFQLANAATPLTADEVSRLLPRTPPNSPDKPNKSDNNDDDDAGGHGSGKSNSSKNRNRKRYGATGTSCGGTGTNEILSKTTLTTSPISCKIPEIDYKEIQLLGLLRNGNHQVYLASWRGQEIAVKLFDMYKDYKWFEREVKAYEHLREVWGILVPIPYFLSDMYGVVALLGMQLGRDPNTGDKNFYEERDRVFCKLLRDHNFEHLDTDHGNVIYIPDGQGKERLVAMDLESHEIVGGSRR